MFRNEEKLGMKYSKYKPTLVEGMKIYNKNIGEGRITKLEPMSFYANYVGGKQAIHNYYDIGKAVFFSKKDYMCLEAYKPKEYALFNDAKCLNDVRSAFKKADEKYFEGKSYKEKELDLENQKYDEVKEFIDDKLKSIDAVIDGTKYVNNGNSDSFDPDKSFSNKQVQTAFREHDLANEIKRNPFIWKLVMPETKDTVYLGKNEVPEQNIKNVRDERYFKYTINDYLKKQLDLLRKLTIKGNLVDSFEDLINKYENTELQADIFLLELMKLYRDIPEAVDIIRSISEEQYDIISKPYDENFILEGCAGSGKTMILLQRLAFMLVNAPDMYKQENIIILSPNKILKDQNVELIKELNLLDTKQFSTMEFYQYHVEKCAKANHISNSQDNEIAEAKASKTMIMNADVNFDTVVKAYSEKSVKIFEMLVKYFYQKPREQYSGFSLESVIEQKKKRMFFEYIGLELNEENDADMFDELTKIGKEYHEVCTSLPKDNIKSRVEILEKRIEAQNIDWYEYFENIESIKAEYAEKKTSIEAQTLDCQNRIQETINIIKEIDIHEPLRKKKNHKIVADLRKTIYDTSKEISSLQLDSKKMDNDCKKKIESILASRSANPQVLLKEKKELDFLKQLLICSDIKTSNAIRNKEGKVVTSPPLFKAALDLCDYVEEKIPGRIVSFSGGVGAFLKKNYLATIYRNASNDFLNGNNREAFVINAILALTSYFKERNKLDVYSIYEFEAFYLTCGLASLYGSIHNDKVMISIDEFQDCAASELKIVKEIYPNAVINMYGETMQAINQKGIDTIPQTIAAEHKHYKLMKNYRNGKEITEHINKELSLAHPMTAIGVPSIVDKVNILSIKALEIKGNKRIALIVKSLEEYERLQYDSSIGNIIDGDGSSIAIDKLNVVPVSLSKGLEFEEVYVYEKNMTTNEKYVAYSRARLELHRIIA